MAIYSAKLALLGNGIDYAGTFPPASLSLEDSLKAAASFRRRGRHPWLLSRVALPIVDLKKLSPRWLYECGADGSPWLFTVLGSTIPDGGDFSRQVEWDLREVRHWNDRWSHSSLRMRAVGYETQIPADIASCRTVDEAYPRLRPVLDRLVSLTGSTVEPYFEISWEGDWRTALRVVANAVAEWCDERHEISVTPGIKVRAGGKHTPTPEQLAVFVTSATSCGLRFKATQGLHHAITSSHGLGFVNLLAALSFSQVLGGESFDEKEVVRLLAETDPRKIELGETSLAYGEHRIELDALEAARRQHAGCFGSCSLDEPDEELATVFK